MRTTWNGSISFGLVNIPVGLAPATAPSARQSDVQFKMLHRDCLTPIRQKRWCPVHDVELAPDEIVRGWEVAKGEFVPVEDAELEAIESHETSRAIEISALRPRGRGRPDLLRPHLLPRPGRRPRRSAGPTRCWSRRCARRRSRRSARSCSPGKEKLCLIRPKGDALALETLFVAEDVKSQDEIDEPVAATGVKKEELALARQIIAGLEGDVRAGRAEERLPGLAARAPRGEARGPRARRAGTRGRGAPVIDLMEALRASVAASKGDTADKKPAGAQEARR